MSQMTLDEFFQQAWKGYSRLTPDAPRVHELLLGRGEKIVNDHVAFRTFNLPGIGRRDLGRIFEGWGYRMVADELDFPDKKLKANYWLHPDASQPKVFISELLLEHFSPDLQDWIRGLAAPLLARPGQPGPEVFLRESWSPVRFEDYTRFYPASEYAAWTAAFGIQLNHFTVLFNSLKSFETLAALNDFLRANGFTLNEAGGAIKGTPAEMLEQSSTMARKVPQPFAGGARHEILGCYYEFAKRYPLPGGAGLFQGFVPKSADKIFESTYEKGKSK